MLQGPLRLIGGVGQLRGHLWSQFRIVLVDAAVCLGGQVGHFSFEAGP